ncbi:hypothetical protein NA56DRAFT_710681 [Hyaloscypha hepaticicola]|uniref:Uncharacterized protein n=1 Tax=Hyaloscypha hepaticicola TaxID=2082293 RepID=A0A2J6PKS3_9HELO|nr:hypothetical protein NA56DRAFT_710681 [Hyaloscypha hepaticicola]
MPELARKLRNASGPEVYLGIGDEEKLGGSSKLSILRERAVSYMKSYPGADNAGPNISLHSELRSLINGKENFTDNILDYLDAALDYRTSLLSLASDYAQFADLNSKDPRRFDVESWFQQKFEETQAGDLRISAAARAQIQKYHKVHQLIAEKKLVGVPLPTTQRPDYEKPQEYLAIAFASSNLSLNEVQDLINRLHDRRCTQNPSFGFILVTKMLTVNNATQYLIATSTVQ